MKKHIRVYLKAMAYIPGEWIPCEICQSKAVDVHHIEARGMGGSKTKDTPENLMGLCRSCHDQFGDVPETKMYLQTIHERHLRLRGFKK